MATAFAEIPQRAVNPLIEGIEIIDVDTHYSEPHDLWTKRAPASLRDRVPQVKPIDGVPNWVIDGQSMGRGAAAISTVGLDAKRVPGIMLAGEPIDKVHPSSWDVKERLKAMAACNIRAQILYPNVMGFGGQEGAQVDAELRLASVQIYNDAMADLQRESGDRIFPMIMVPWWDPQLAAKEIRRMAAQGLKGVNLNSDPQTYPGLPDLGDRHWDPMWEACVEHQLPVNFHIGASSASMDWLGSMPWKSQDFMTGFALGGTMLFFGNARVMANLLVCGLLDRFPTLQFVSVESGIGWVPFLLEALDHQMGDVGGVKGELTPTEYFDRNFHSCFWFEKRHLASSVRAVGVNKVMFETDFPHPTCVYPESADFVMDGLAALTWTERNRILSLNARELYHIDV